MNRVARILCFGCLPWVALLGSACYYRAVIPPANLVQLDGYRAGSPKVIRDEQGEAIPFDAKSKLIMIVRAEGDRPQETHSVRLTQIDVREGVLTGKLPSAANLAVPIQAVDFAQVENFSDRQTTGLVMGILGGAAVTAFLGMVLALLSTLPFAATG